MELKANMGPQINNKPLYKTRLLVRSPRKMLILRILLIPSIHSKICWPKIFFSLCRTKLVEMVSLALAISAMKLLSFLLITRKMGWHLNSRNTTRTSSNFTFTNLKTKTAPLHSWTIRLPIVHSSRVSFTINNSQINTKTFWLQAKPASTINLTNNSPKHKMSPNCPWLKKLGITKTCHRSATTRSSTRKETQWSASSSSLSTRCTISITTIRCSSQARTSNNHHQRRSTRCSKCRSRWKVATRRTRSRWTHRPWTRPLQHNRCKKFILTKMAFRKTISQIKPIHFAAWLEQYRTSNRNKWILTN